MRSPLWFLISALLMALCSAVALDSDLAPAINEDHLEVLRRHQSTAKTTAKTTSCKTTAKTTAKTTSCKTTAKTTAKTTPKTTAKATTTCTTKARTTTTPKYTTKSTTCTTKSKTPATTPKITTKTTSAYTTASTTKSESSISLTSISLTSEATTASTTPSTTEATTPSTTPSATTSAFVCRASKESCPNGNSDCCSGNCQTDGFGLGGGGKGDGPIIDIPIATRNKRGIINMVNNRPLVSLLKARDTPGRCFPYGQQCVTTGSACPQDPTDCCVGTCFNDDRPGGSGNLCSEVA